MVWLVLLGVGCFIAGLVFVLQKWTCSISKTRAVRYKKDTEDVLRTFKNNKEKRNKSKNGKNVVLVSTGSYSPIHKEHITIFKEARKTLEEKGYNVIGGLACPSYDFYLWWKMLFDKNSHKSIPGEDRYEMCRLALNEYYDTQAQVDPDSERWIYVVDWELHPPSRFLTIARLTFLPVKSYLYSVLKTFECELKQNDLEDVELMFLCGADTLISGKLLQGIGNDFKSVVCGRPNYTHKLKELVEQGKVSLVNVIVVPCELANVSSTLIRQEYLSGNSVSKWTFKSVADYITQHNIKFK